MIVNPAWPLMNRDPKPMYPLSPPNVRPADPYETSPQAVPGHGERGSDIAGLPGAPGGGGVGGAGGAGGGGAGGQGGRGG